ncbi:MAG: membrane protein insertion efficiency factor YidD [Peredibacter sp.]|nr:membrane protein insertion efficiency factor YidD [Peredibacter sp.]
MKKFISTIIIFPIRLYQYAISPLLGSNCRFYPSCSSYAIEAVEKLPLYTALPKIVWRIIRCHPFSKGGDDPVI